MTSPWALLLRDAQESLFRKAGIRLQQRSIRVSLADRVVFDAVTSGGAPAVIKASWDGPQLDKERLVLEHAHDVPVPQVLAFVYGSPTVLVMSKIDGRPACVQEGDEVWKDIGCVLGRLHGIPPPLGAPRFDSRDADWGMFVQTWVHDAFDRAGRHGLISRREGDRLRSGFAEHVSGIAPPRRVLLHGDCQADHFLTAGGKVSGVVDFGDARIGDPTWDVAVLALKNPDKLDAVLCGYKPATELRDHIQRWLPAYRLLRLLGAVCWHYENGLPHEQDLSELQARLSCARPWLS